jgi:hypothetical protein
MMMGSGKLFNVRDFTIDLYENFGMKYEEYVTENRSLPPNDKLIRANVNWNYSYSDLLEDTVKDIQKYKSKNN